MFTLTIHIRVRYRTANGGSESGFAVPAEGKTAQRVCCDIRSCSRVGSVRPAPFSRDDNSPQWTRFEISYVSKLLSSIDVLNESGNEEWIHITLFFLPPHAKYDSIIGYELGNS